MRCEKKLCQTLLVIKKNGCANLVKNAHIFQKYTHFSKMYTFLKNAHIFHQMDKTSRWRIKYLGSAGVPVTLQYRVTLQ